MRTRAALLAFVSASSLIVPDLASAQPRRAATRPPAAPVQRTVAGDTITTIRVEGNQRIEEGTIRSYMLVQPGDPYDADRIDRSLKTLYATGLFADVSISRDGSGLVVRVKENPIVNRIAFEGNHKLKDDALRSELQLRPRAVYTAALAQADRQRILDLYARRGRFAARVEPKIVDLGQNRVDVVFEITEGDTTLISRIAFVGNKAFSENRLKEVVGSRESAWWRFLSSSDTYDPDRVAYDKELLRRFYLKNGYADFEVTGAAAELAPDKSAFFLTYTVSEGERYRVSKVSVNSSLRNISSESLLSVLDMDSGDWYDGDSVERTTQALTDAVQSRGQPFVDVKPRVSRDREKHTIELVFDVTEGPRVYVERIDITGNTRTMDKVIRREFRLAEGDAFNAALLRRSRQRLQDLNYFNSVTLTPVPGSAPDRANINAQIEERATGELTIGGGYSTDSGALANFGIRERNLVGTGIDTGINALIAQKSSQIDLSVTDPYFLDRNLVAGIDVFRVTNDNQTTAEYSERRLGFSVRLGYEFSEHLRQAWAYSLVNRNVYDVQSSASLYVQEEKGTSLLSQIGQTLTLDYRDSRIDPRQGWVMRVGADFAGIGGDAHYLRTKLDGTYFVPLERYFGSNDWNIAISGGIGYLFTLGNNEKIIDRFFLGGDNLRGFQTGGAGPHAIPTPQYSGADSLGGRFIWTQSTEFRFPLPVSADLGLSGRVFVDIGALSQVNPVTVNGVQQPYTDDAAPRVGAGVGVSWKTPFGLINIDLAQAVVKKAYDQTQFFRFGFGTRF
ncbi:Outer membrane protein assembly factor BamA [Rhodovastum atsumiense]|uniref:outer membrane protein assembly factor BamA n=1 Tax=Rhodovastum atsumiense TaxID=504468 RepID=UPI001EEF9CF7|nr:outer membrane protein assembly factor BamA [Rhodovastum atsumiense]CAH2599015.1 Outer membrane protein assembly factor BamA [Rhodovastum atsumiense]